MSNEIIFTNIINILEEYKPTPASLSIPGWYKDMESYIGNQKKPSGKGFTSATIKRCMPVFDAITAGYILYTYADIYVSQKDGIPQYECRSFATIDFHPIVQAPTYPGGKGLSGDAKYPKFLNPWSIKTPKGYSTLFTQPFHRDSVFTILDGIVDTDKYDAPVNFPFVLNDWSYEGLIPAGTPIAQVIPFKRENWKMRIGTQEDLINQDKTSTYINSFFFDAYKNKFRKIKEYK
jgi:hypothetical protein